MQSRRPYQISSPWSPNEMDKRGSTAPRPEKAENIFSQSRVPTSSSKYGSNQIQTSGISIKGSGYTSHNPNPRQPIKTPSSVHNEVRQEIRHARPIDSPIPENIEHVWEEGTKRPKTQNIKCRRTSTDQETPAELLEVFPGKSTQNSMKMYEVPIIVVKDDRNRKSANVHKNSKYGARPSTNRPVGALMSSLDQDFLDLFQS